LFLRIRVLFRKSVIDSLELYFLFQSGWFIAIAIWLEDRGCPFYCSVRIGKHGRAFKHIKFRTMVRDSDARFGPLQAGENEYDA
jgi:lipopolysaccharide/colanic/teichoic acid biosynthesis glycosyltransferase